MKGEMAILGFGNPVREDDGVGIYVIDELKKILPPEKHDCLFDMGTSAFEVLFKIKEYKSIILVDAVMNSGHPTGSTFKLPASEIEAQIIDDPMVFLHGLKWDQALSYAKKMLGNDYPANVEVYLIAIENTTFNVGMSEAATKGGDQVVQLLLENFKN